MIIKADTGVIISDGDRAQLGQTFTTMAGQLVAMGVPLSTAVKVAQKFVPSSDLDEDIMAELGAGESEGMDESLWEQLNAGRGMGG